MQIKIQITSKQDTVVFNVFSNQLTSGVEITIGRYVLGELALNGNDAIEMAKDFGSEFESLGSNIHKNIAQMIDSVLDSSV